MLKLFVFNDELVRLNTRYGQYYTTTLVYWLAQLLINCHKQI